MATGGRDRSPAPTTIPIGVGALHTLPPTLKPAQAFELVGIGRTSGYERIRDGRIPSVRLGGKLLIPTLPLLRMLGAEVGDSCPTSRDGSLGFAVDDVSPETAAGVTHE
jgi:predicted DNA-binding transcriptional regulator AlpA